MEKEISIIIPVYNVEQYLDRCVQSVVSQSCDNWEAILVDDGSTDSSGLLCDAWARKNCQIRVIHQSNHGLSAARNLGIEVSNGNYIVLLDSDDYLKENAIEHILRHLHEYKPNVLYGKAVTVDDSGRVKGKVKYQIDQQLYTGLEYVTQLSKSTGGVTFCAQFGVYSKAFLEQNHLRFCEGIIHEDELWTPCVILKADRIFFMDEFFYFHYVRNGSIMHSGNREKSAVDTIKVCERLKAIYSNYPKRQIPYLRDRLAMLFLRAIPDFPSSPENMYQFERAFPLKYAGSAKNKAKALIYCLFPKAYCLISKQTRKR